MAVGFKETPHFVGLIALNLDLAATHRSAASAGLADAQSEFLEVGRRTPGQEPRDDHDGPAPAPRFLSAEHEAFALGFVTRPERVRPGRERTEIEGCEWLIRSRMGAVILAVRSVRLAHG